MTTDARARLHAMFNLFETDEAELNARIDAVIAEETAGLRARVAELEGTPGGEAQTGPIVAYRDPNNPHMLFCRTHAEHWAGLSPLTSHDLPDGGICTLGYASGSKCGRDVLAVAAASTA